MSINNLPPKYNPEAVEGKWYEYWMQHNMFHSVPDGREPYSIVIPPPNVTGVLHMGHMLNNTIQDILVRRARIQGKNAIGYPAPTMPLLLPRQKLSPNSPKKASRKATLHAKSF